MFQGWDAAWRLRSAWVFTSVILVTAFCSVQTGFADDAVRHGAYEQAPYCPPGTLPPPMAQQWQPDQLQAPYFTQPQFGAPGEQPGTALLTQDGAVIPAGAESGGEAVSTAASPAPQMIGDFFGNTSGRGSLIPGALTGQAIFVQPAGLGLVDYYRRVDTTGMAGTFVTNNLVLLPSAGAGTVIVPMTLLSEFDDAGTFVGDPADLGVLTDAGPFLAVSNGTAAVVNLVAPEVGGPLLGEQLFDIRRAVFVDILTPGQVVGRTKIAENTSPIPTDRVFLNFSDFNDVPLTASGVNIRRFSPGWERTMFDGRMSWEIRVPMAVTLDTDITADGITDSSKSELGDVMVTLKHLLHRTDRWATSAGVSVTIPTAQDIRLVLDDRTELLEVENETVHVMPFVGALFTPNDRFFAQFFVQGDFDASGSPVSVNNFRGSFDGIGTIHDTSFIYADASFGFWVYRNLPTVRRQISNGVRHVHIHQKGPLGLSGVAPMMEFHFNRSLGSTDTITSGPFQVGNSQGSIEAWNLVLGGTMEFGPNLTLTGAYVQPIGSGVDKQFAHEVRVFANWFVGR